MLFIHSSADGCLDCFHPLAIVNSAAMSTFLFAHLFSVLSSIYLEVELLGHIKILCLLQVFFCRYSLLDQGSCITSVLPF